MKFRKIVYHVVFWSSYYSRYASLAEFDNYFDAEVYAFSEELNSNALLIQKKFIRKSQ